MKRQVIEGGISLGVLAAAAIMAIVALLLMRS